MSGSIPPRIKIRGILETVMKFISKLVLILLFIPLFLILLTGVTVRFQFLSPSFWQNAFSTNGTYSKLSVSINKNLESQTIAKGGRASDVRIFTDLITPENLKDVIDRNIINILGYANGKVKEIIVYVPLNKIPKSLLSNNFGKISEQMKLTDLLKEFNIIGVTPAQIQMISQVGLGAWIFLMTIMILSVLMPFLLYLLVDSGKKLITPGAALIISGLVTLLITGAGTVIRINMAKDLAGRSNLNDSMIGIVAPPVIQGILKLWLLFAVVAIILGIVLFFIKKPYNKDNKK